MTGPDTVGELLAALRALPGWPAGGDFTPADWRRYVAAARAVQRADPADVERALTRLTREDTGFVATANETRAFLLLRLVFALPEHAPARRRRTFKGWVNWPPPDERGAVDLSWPVRVRPDGPVLLAPYAGAEGPRYAAELEYRHLLATYPYRDLDPLTGPTRSVPE